MKLQEMQLIIATAEAEGRDLTREEQERFDRLYNETGGLNRNEWPAASAVGAFDKEEDEPQPENRSAILARDESIIPFFRQSGSDFKDLTFGSFVRSMVCGARTTAERRALSEGSDSAGGYTVPTPLMGGMIDALRNKTVVIQAGAQTVALTSDDQSIAKLATDPSASWRLENASVSESDPTFSRVRFQPKTLACIVRASRELVEDSQNLDSAMQRAFAASMAAELDRVALVGDSANDEPVGLSNSGITELILDDYIQSYDPILDAMEDLEVANADAPTASIMAPRTKTQFAKLVDSTGQPLRKPEALTNLPFLSTNAVPIDEEGSATENNASRIFVGDFRQLFVGIRTQLRVEVLRERYVDNLQYAWLAYLRADIGLAHDESFVQITGVMPTS